MKKKSLPRNRQTIDGNRIASDVFAKMIRAFQECSDEIQAAVYDMADIVNSTAAAQDEKDAALATIEEALFPSRHAGDYGVDLENTDGMLNKQEKEADDELQAEEASFADRLQAAMDRRGLTQRDLAQRIGVGQSAISMMLNRQCRPQRRTVAKFAKALKVPAGELWSE